MDMIKLIEINKHKILPELYEWAETFCCEEVDEGEDKGEPSLESYYFVFDLAKRLEEGKCNIQDYEDILFHIEQINYNETKIAL